MMRRNTIEVRNLAIGYTGKHSIKRVAEGISDSISSGYLTCLLGENGAGKTTLLRTLSGFQPALEGEISLMGKALESYKEKELATVIAVVLTERSNLQNMTVFELVGMGRSPYTGFWGRLSKEDRDIVDRAIAMVGIEALKDRMVQTLSDGERQKVMIAKALSQQTPVIFLDEPTAFLDYPSKVEILQLLHRLSREADKTIFLSTHDLELALQIADRLWLMAKGRGVVAGCPEDLALDGTLDTFFSRKGVAFERQTGLYRIEPEYRTTVRLQGEGVRCQMLRKALRRNGIMASEDADSEYSIVVPSDPEAPYETRKGSGNATLAKTISEILELIQL